MTPTLNVNLRQCTCGHDRCPPDGPDACGVGHVWACKACPVLIPCPIPRSVTFSFSPWNCSPACSSTATMPDGRIRHRGFCAARSPIRVSCSISGKTWEESEVSDVDGIPPHPTQPVIAEVQALLACRARWALVKALALGDSADTFGGFLQRWPTADQLIYQRDAVFSALADKVRAEQADDSTTRHLIAVLPKLAHRSVSDATASDYLSTPALAAYVEHLIEQIGVMP